MTSKLIFRNKIIIPAVFIFIFSSGFLFAQGTVTVSGAGTTAVNGVYTEAGTANSRPYYTFGIYRIEYRDGGFGVEWEIWDTNEANPSLEVKYFNSSTASTPPETGWQVDVATAPAPTLSVVTNQAPVLAAIEGTTLAYTENDTATAITSLITVSDADDTNIESATVQITTNYQNGQDVLSFTDQNGISGTWTAATGTMALSGSATKANYQTALRDVKYSNNSDNPNTSTRTVSFTVNDGTDNSNTQTRQVSISAVNDSPVLAAIEGTTLAYTENDAATAITSAITVSDADDTNIESAVVQITGNYQNGQDVLSFTNQNGITGTWTAATGTMALSGSATKANYQTALRDVKYNNTSDNPNTSTRTVSFTVNDGDANSNTSTRQVSVAASNDAPVLAAIEGTTLAYTEGDAATSITSTITVADADDTNIESAAVQITGNYQNGQDILSFTNQNGISGTWTAATGTMALSGSATKANYETALRDVKYNNTSNNPNTSARTASFTINDGDVNSNTQTRQISVTTVNEAPVLAAIEGTTLNYTENDAATAITSSTTVSDGDDTNIESATIQITTNYQNGQDVLSFTNQNGISGTWTAATGTMALSGSATKANYQTALRDVKYSNSSDDPSISIRTVSFTVNDGTDNSNTQTRQISVSVVNDSPVLAAIEGTTLSFTEGDAATSITSAITVTDLDDTNIESAVIQITGNYQNGQDVLSFTNQNGISGTWTAATGTMSLTGSATKANYQTALRDVKYNNASDNPNTSTRTVSFTVNDGDANSNTSTRQISITAVNDTPVLAAIEGTTLAYTEGDAATAITGTVTVTDVDDTNIESATIQITGNYQNGQDVLSFTDQNGITGTWTAATGTMALSGSATKANYETALRDVKYNNTSNNPNTSTRTVSFTVNDGDANSNTLTRQISVTSVNEAPVLAAIEGTTLSYTENDAATAITGSITVSDNDDTNIESATIQITTNYQNGQDVLSFTDQNGITGTWTAATGTMALSGSATKANYQTALRDVKYSNSSDNPNTSTRTATFTVNDGDANSNTQTRQVSVSAVNDSPVLAAIEGTTLAYTENDAATAITSAITVSDADDTNIESAVVQITGNYQNGQDVLSFTNQNGITGTWTAATGTMALSGSATKANYQTALRDVKYSNTSDNPNTSTRTVSFTVNDGDANSNTSTRQVSVAASNDAPVLAAIEGTTLAYTEGDAATAITSAITVADVDDTNIESAVVQITGNYQNGQDVLSFTNQNGITGTWTAATGTMSLSGSATKANYQTALRDVKYNNTSNNPNTSARTVSFTVNDGTDNSNTQTRQISITVINNPPTLTATGNSPTFTEGGAAADLYSTVTVSTTEGSQTILEIDLTVTNVNDGASEILSIDGSDVTLTNGNSVTTASNSMTVDVSVAATTASVAITKAGGISTANAQTLVDGITYRNTNDNPNTSNRVATLTYIKDNGGTANSGDDDTVLSIASTVTVTPVNDPPVITNLHGDNVSVVAGSGSGFIDDNNNTTVTNPDAADYNGGFITISQSGGTTNGSYSVDGTNVTSGGNAVIAAGEIIAVGGTSIGTVHATNDGQAGNSLRIDFNANAVNSNLQTLIRNLKYLAPSGVDTRTFTLTLNDADGITNSGDQDATATFTIDVTPNPPVLTNIDGDNASVSVGGAAGNIDVGGNSTVIDADSPNFNTGNFSIVQNSGTANGNFSVTGSGASGVASGTSLGTADKIITGSEIIYVDGVAIASVSASSDGQSGDDLVLNLGSNATPARTQQVIRALQYAAPSGSGNRTFTLSVQDANVGGGTSTANFTITISPPEMDLKQGTIAIADGGSFNYGNKALNSDNDITFTIHNTAAGVLSITTPITLAGTDPGQFSIQQQPSTTVAANDSTTFIIRFTPTSAGAKSATIAITNNDTNENPYNITLNGSGNTLPTGGNDVITMNEDATYTFSPSDFTFNDPDTDTFAGIQLQSLETAGTLTYDGIDVVTLLDYSDMSKLRFTPLLNGSGSPYATFTFKVKDSNGGYSAATYTMTINVNAKPTVTINQASGQSDPSNSSTINFTVVFSESVTGFATGDVTLSGTAGATTGTMTETAPNNGTTYNVAVTGMTASGTVIATIAAGVASDAGGALNKLSTSTDNSVAYDGTVPSGYSVAIDQPAINLINKGAISFTFGTAEINAIFNYTFSSSNGGTNVTGSGTITSANQQITGVDLGGLIDGIITLSVTLTDPLGNTGNAVTDTKTKDTVQPTVSITSTASNPTNASPFTVTIDFSEGAAGFVLGDISVSNGNAGNFQVVNSAQYQADITPASSGTVSVNVAANVAQDLAGNNNTAATQYSVIYDNTTPTGYSVSIDQPVINLGNKESISFTFAGAEVGAIYNYTFASSDGGTNATGSGTITTSSQQVTNINLSGLNDGTITLSVTLTDVVGNAGNPATDTKIKDTIQPALSITTAETNVKNNVPFTVEINFSEPVTGFDVGDIVIGNGLLSSFTIVTSSQYTVDVTPLTLGIVTVDIAGSVAKDIAENDNSAAVEFSIIAMNNAPALATIEGTTLFYTEKDAATSITSTLTVGDVDNANMSGASVSISENYKTGEDVLSFTSQNGIIGSWDASTGTITFSGSSTKANYEAALRNVKYHNTNNNPSTLTRTISFVVNDGTSNSSTSTRQVNVTAVNDSPVISFQLSPPSVNEDESLTISYSAMLPFISDPDNLIDALEISYEYSGNHFNITEPSDSLIVIEPKTNWFGLDSITVKVSDGHSTTSAPFAINVISVNDLPEFINLPESINLTGNGPIAVDIFNIANDVETPDDLLQFEFSTGNDSLLFNYDSENGILNLTTASGYKGETVLTIKATDENDGVSEISINILVENNVTGIEKLLGQIPNEYEIYQNYPNPFNPSTIIRYGLPEESNVTVRIFNILGQEVQTLFNGTQRAGYHEQAFNGSRLASGMYIYSIYAESSNGNKKYSQVRKMLMIK